MFSKKNLALAFAGEKISSALKSGKPKRPIPISRQGGRPVEAHNGAIRSATRQGGFVVGENERFRFVPQKCMDIFNRIELGGTGVEWDHGHRRAVAHSAAIHAHRNAGALEN